MTTEQQAQHESARAEAEAIYQRSMMETNAIVLRARMPAPPRPIWWRRLLRMTKHNSTDGVAVPAPARYPDHTAFCCGSAHNCRQPEKSCAMRGDVLGREHERGRPADGVSGRCHQTFCTQTPIPSPMDYEGEG